MWNVHSVLNVLHSLVDKSNINKQLEVYNNQGNQDQVAGDFGRHSLYKMLGYFSLVGLLSYTPSWATSTSPSRATRTTRSTSRRTRCTSSCLSI